MKNPTLRAALGPDAQPFRYTCAGVRRTGYVRRCRQNKKTFRSDAPQLVEDHWRILAAQDVRLFIGPAVFEVAPGKFARSYEVDPDDPGASRRRLPCFDQVFALPGLPTLDVIEFARVGSHNVPSTIDPEAGIDALRHLAERAGPEFLRQINARSARLRASEALQPHGPRPWTFVRAALAQIAAICPFEIQSADPAGLRATFLKKVPPKRVAKIVDLVGTLNPEAFDVAAGELTSRGIPVPPMPDFPDLPDDQAAMTRCIADLGILCLWWD